MNEFSDGFDLPSLMTLKALDENSFRSERNERNNNNRVYGGQLMGQAVSAAAQTVPGDRAPTILQMVFLSGARDHLPIDYAVTILQEGKSFSSRHIIGRQGTTGVISAHVSFQRSMAEPRHQAGIGGFTGTPDTAVAMQDIGEDLLKKLRLTGYQVSQGHPWIEWRLADPAELFPDKSGTELRFWVRIKRKLPANPRLHESVLAYMSDWWLNFISIAPHINTASSQGYYIATLNHSLWFHAPCQVDDWLLFVAQSPWANNSRGLSTGRIYQNGAIVASVAQEALQTERLTA